MGRVNPFFLCKKGRNDPNIDIAVRKEERVAQKEKEERGS